MNLKLVKPTNTIADTETLMSDLIGEPFDCIDWTLTSYGPDSCARWTGENREHGQDISIIFDPKCLHTSKQGIHHHADADTSVDTLIDLLEQADRDSFGTIWIHA